MQETEPLYFKNFREHFDKRMDGVDSSIDTLAIITNNRFDILEKRVGGLEMRFDNLESDVSEIKGTIEKIEAHIGRYEIRSQNLEQIILQDHKPRIIDLEKKVFA